MKVRTLLQGIVWLITLNKAKEKHFDLSLNVLFGLRAVRVPVCVPVCVCGCVFPCCVCDKSNRSRVRAKVESANNKQTNELQKCHTFIMRW